jgi:hypothetical protein
MGLIKWFESLPDWCFVSVDNAYPLMLKILVPHNSTELWSDSHIAFNFYLSQLKIRIEMAFGRLTTKWRRLWTTIFYDSVPQRRSPLSSTIQPPTPIEHHHLCRHPSLMDDYTRWFDEWSSWDLYSPIVSEIDEDIEELLLVYGLLLGSIATKEIQVPAYTCKLGVSCWHA